jgi:glycosyltransferase involved in cell wall biosynthesis
VIGLLNTRCYADSESQRQFLVTENVIPENKIGVIGAGSLAGVDLDRFNPVAWSAAQKEQLRGSLSCPPSAQILIFIGRITRDKGILELLSAFKGLQRDYDIDLLLVGPLDEECGGKPSIPVEQLLATPRVHHVGYSPTPENYLAIADILCLPSYREGFGTVVIEAAAMEVPTIGTDINGLKDAVSDGETGLLVPPQDSAALCEAIKNLLDSPDLRQRMKDAARRRCEQLFDAAIINRQLSSEYLRLLKQDT